MIMSKLKLQVLASVAWEVANESIINFARAWPEVEDKKVGGGWTLASIIILLL